MKINTTEIISDTFHVRERISYYAEMISMIPFGHNRPAIPEYSEMASHIKQALDDVYYGLKNPKRALDDAATRSAAVLGWWFPNGINAIYGHFKFLYYLFGVMICISLFIQRRI